MSQDQEDLRELDYVYAGRRINGTKVVAAVFVVLAPSKLGEERLFELKYLKGSVQGGVYRGAKFSSRKVQGLGAAKYVSRWPDNAAQIDWRARDEQAEERQRTDKLLKDAKKVHEIEAIMRPLRALYAGYCGRRDSAGCEALEQAVLRALRVTPRASE